MSTRANQHLNGYLLVARWWAKTAAKARRRAHRLALWPWRNSKRHIAAAQIALEIERARRASGENGGRA